MVRSEGIQQRRSVSDSSLLLFFLFYRAMEGICPLFSFYFAVDGAESNINQGDCTGTAIPDTIANRPPFSSYNHVGHCGFVNVFLFGSPRCTINLFPPS